MDAAKETAHRARQSRWASVIELRWAISALRRWDLFAHGGAVRLTIIVINVVIGN